ncbi:hypothetical protein I8752_12490 [Nostocaceae cyanobacterium CENA369]|jgi:hypothetical protein|uniref:Uncharacterized protein n=1 Tax=Dendronalium phyllosphericum CENA369 TaxID=1725256 RepID=A0A8J7I0P1_9NOST|nr:hypothetical protein [Dendronalium phyllosphericum]MBH8573825.1 hypothetical protein [Dendronalium phyllosphericum CENA369]
MNRKPYSTEITDKPIDDPNKNLTDNSKIKIWVWSAVGLIITNFVVVGIVAFLIHRDSVQYNPNRSLTEQRQDN